MDSVEQIKSRINIADLLREYIELKKAGANWKALCPFHSEKSPSFMVSEDKQIWHCFGCNEGGDIFGFVMRMEGVDFPEALRLLAKKAGVELVHRDPAQNSQKTKLMDILEAATGFYSGELIKSPVAREYINKRELKDETVKKFRLGFSPQSWDSLLKFLQAKNYQPRDIALAGLLIEKDGGPASTREGSPRLGEAGEPRRGGGFYDRFRGRVMFPIFNHYGNTVGFTARVLPQFDDGKSGKYINTPETAAYKKSEVLYGLNFAKQEIKKEGRVIVVEGNMDVIALQQAGVLNVVATSGTALTNEQLNLLRRYTDNMVVCFDADAAGIAAALRGIDLALAHGFNVRVFGMPKNDEGEPVAKDPDELIKKSPELWHQAMNATKHIVEFYIAANVAKYNLGDPHENAAFCKIILKEISKIKNSVERSLWIKKLADVSGVDERDLREMTSAPKTMSRSAAIPEAESSVEPSTGLKYLGLALSDAKKYLPALRDVLPEMMERGETREFYKDILFYYNENKGFSLQGFRDFLGSTGKNPLFLDKLAMLKDRDYAGAEDEEIEREVKNLSLRIKNNYFKEQREILKQEMILAERDGNKEKIKILMEKFKALNS